MMMIGPRGSWIECLSAAVGIFVTLRQGSELGNQRFVPRRGISAALLQVTSGRLVLLLPGACVSSSLIILKGPPDYEKREFGAVVLLLPGACVSSCLIILKWLPDYKREFGAVAKKLGIKILPSR